MFLLDAMTGIYGTPSGMVKRGAVGGQILETKVHSCQVPPQ